MFEVREGSLSAATNEIEVSWVIWMPGCWRKCLARRGFVEDEENLGPCRGKQSEGF